MIHIVDYGLGNVQAFLSLFKRIGIESKRTNSPNDLCNADFIVLPGVGHFDHAMESLNNSGLRKKLDELVLVKKIPIIGIAPYKRKN